MKIKNLRKLGMTSVVTAALAFSGMFSFAAEGGAGTSIYESIFDLGDGFTYMTSKYENGSSREESFRMSTTPNNTVKPIVLACDVVYGSLNINKVMEYASQSGYNVLGAINSDFFSMKTGVPMGIAVENGVYKTSPSGFPSVCFDAAGSASIVDYTAVQITMTNQGGAPVQEPVYDEAGNLVSEGVYSNYGKSVELAHYNKLRQNGAGMYLLNEYFGGSTVASSSGWYVKFQVLEGTMKTQGTVKLQVVEAFKASGPQEIRPGFMYLTADDSSGLDYQFRKFAVGDVVMLETSTYGNAALANCQWATGGGNVLIKDGAVTSSSGWDSSLAGRNPRTALGIRADGTVLYYVIDGRQSESAGLTMSQLANELLAQGCVNAINFDGGGSSAMAVKLPDNYTAQVVNSPSEGALRRCSTYILLVSENASNGIAKNLGLVEQGTVVYQGASLPLSYNATDAGHNPAAVPGDVAASVLSGHGSITGNTYTAGWVAGTETISMSSPSTGGTGAGSVYVVNRLSDIAVKANGQEVSSLHLSRGDSVQFAASASYYGKYVAIDQTSFEYAMSGDFGTLSDTGLLTIDEKAPSGSGIITIAAGGVTKTINISVGGVFSDITGHWAENPITELYNKGIVTGSGSGTFGPNNYIKRGDFILMLYRTAGSPEASPVNGFLDVSSSDYYASAVSWAKKNGIAQGDGANFKPNANMKREEAFTFMYRYLKEQGKDFEDGDYSKLEQFSDASSVSEYAVTPTATLVSLGIVDGSNGRIQPSGMLTRAQMAKILHSSLAI